MNQAIAVGPGRRRGGDPNREAFWREVVARHQRGGLGVRAFCAGEGLAESAFYFWRREIERRDHRAGNRRRSTPVFVELTAARSLEPHSVATAQAATSTAAIELCLPPQRRLLIRGGCDLTLLRQVLAVLEGKPSALED